jgi:3-oxoadipate enol-lactonase
MTDTADLGDVTIAYELLGDPDAPRLVHVSGSGSDLRRKPRVADTALVEHFQVLAYDHRGLGRSTAGPHRPTMAEFGHDLLRLLDHVGWDRCFAVGVSFGGMVLQEAAVSAPWRFPKLVLACTSAGGQGGASYPLHELIDLAPEDRRHRWVDALDTRNSDPDRHAAVLSVIEAMEAARESPAQTSGEVAQLLARRDHDTWHRLPALTMPVLIAAGRHDGIAPPANQETMASQLAEPTIEWFDGGHGFFFEDRRAYPTIIDFLLS